MGLLFLPGEILSVVASLLERRDLCAVCLSHPKFVPVFQQRLFHHVRCQEMCQVESVSNTLERKAHLKNKVAKLSLDFPFALRNEYEPTKVRSLLLMLSTLRNLHLSINP